MERLLEETAKIDYPHELLQIQVLDDSTDDTHPFTRALVEDYRETGLPIEYIHRTNGMGSRQERSKTDYKPRRANWSPSSTRTLFLPTIF